MAWSAEDRERRHAYRITLRQQHALGHESDRMLATMLSTKRSAMMIA